MILGSICLFFLILPLFLKDIFVEYRILGCYLFSSSTFNASFKCLLISFVGKKITLTLFFSKDNLFTLAALKISSLSLVFHSLTIIFLSMSFFCIYLAWDLLGILWCL